MSGFTKLSGSLTSSSIWNEADAVRIVFITMLSLADADGIVRGSVGGLAHLARKSKAETEEALRVLSSPDSDSSRLDAEGRRIVAVPGGWRLVNHAFYRELGMSEETKAYWREKKRQQRERVKDSRGQSGKDDLDNGTVNGSETVVEGGNGGKPEKDFDAFWKLYPRKQGKPPARAAFLEAHAAHQPNRSGRSFLGEIKRALAWQIKLDQWRDVQFIPLPATYIKDRRYEDEPPASVNCDPNKHFKGSW